MALHFAITRDSHARLRHLLPFARSISRHNVPGEDEALCASVAQCLGVWARHGALAEVCAALEGGALGQPSSARGDRLSRALSLAAVAQHASVRFAPLEHFPPPPCPNSSRGFGFCCYSQSAAASSVLTP